jgi:hypothetical protein
MWNSKTLKIQKTFQNWSNFRTSKWLWFEIIIILKDKTLNLQGIRTLSKINIYSKIIFKKCHVLGQL